MANRDRWLAKALLYLVLELGAFVGVPMRPKDIELMTRMMTDSLIAESVKGDQERTGDPLIPGLDSD